MYYEKIGILMVSILFQKKQSVILVSKIVLVEFLQVLVCILSNEHYMCSSLLQLAPGLRDLSQEEKRITVQ